MEMPPPLPGEGPPQADSLSGRLLNVFAAPGDVFEDIKGRAPSTANWLAPVLLGCLMGMVFSLVVFSQDSILRSIQEMQEQRIRSQLQKQVDAGKLSREQVEQAVQLAQRFSGPTVMKVIGCIAAVVMNFGTVFLVGLLIWLVGTKGFKADFDYMKAVEAAGLAGMIDALGGLVKMLLAVLTGTVTATPGPVLLVRVFNPADRLHLLLSHLNVMSIWYVAVAAMGLAKLSNVSYGRAAAWSFGVWSARVLASVLPGWAL
jgi:hypothetical protein